MSDYVIINGELYHHGVKGMKWGVRRKRISEAKIARKTAIQKSVADSKARPDAHKLGSGRRGMIRAKKAGEEAYRKSLYDSATEKERARMDVEDAKKAYNKAFNKADSGRLNAFNPSKKARLKNEQRWADVYDTAKALNAAEKKYKAIRKDEKAKKKAEKIANKTIKKMEKQRIQDLRKRYGQLEDQYTYGKKADAKKNSDLGKQMADIERELRRSKG